MVEAILRLYCRAWLLVVAPFLWLGVMFGIGTIVGGVVDDSGGS